MFYLPPRTRRIVYVATFETLAIVLSAMLLAVLSGGTSSQSLPVAVAISTVAVLWNYVFNTVFEKIEQKLKRTERSLMTRIVHSSIFETGLLLFCLPLYMYWYQVDIIEAFRMEALILLFFLVYTFVFTWVFDLIFALPHQRAIQAQ